MRDLLPFRKAHLPRFRTKRRPCPQPPQFLRARQITGRANEALSNAHAAFLELLRGRSQYEATSANESPPPPPFKHGAISLPNNVTRSPDMAGLVRLSGRFCLRRGWRAHCDRNRACANETSPSKESGWLRILDWFSLRRRTYKLLVKDRAGRGVVVSPPPTNSYRASDCLFVRRMGHQLMRQIILDACRSRQHVNRPPRTWLVVGEGLAKVDLDIGGRLVNNASGCNGCAPRARSLVHDILRVATCVAEACVSG